MLQQFIGILIMQLFRNRNIVNFIVLQAYGIVFLINNTLNALIGNLPADIVFVIGTKDKFTIASILCI